MTATQPTLLDNIKQEIASAGGRIALGWAIVSENRYLFSRSDFKYFKDRHQWNSNRRLRQGTKFRKDLWSAEDLEFITNNFGAMRTSRISAIINRSPAAIRLKFADVATEEQKVKAESHYNKSRRSTNFKRQA